MRNQFRLLPDKEKLVRSLSRLSLKTTTPDYPESHRHAMSKKRGNLDQTMVQLTLPLSEIPSGRQESGTLRTKERVKAALKRGLSECGIPRDVIAEELSRLTGEHVSIHSLNNWVAPGKDDRTLPLEYAAALTVITGDMRIVQAALSCAGILTLSEKEAQFYHLGKLVAEERSRAKTKRELFDRIKV